MPTVSYHLISKAKLEEKKNYNNVELTSNINKQKDSLKEKLKKEQ